MKKRTIFKQIWQNIDSPDILLLNGARQVGKTTLLEMIKQKLISEKNIPETHILWFDLEKVEDLAIWSDQSTALNQLPLNNKQKYYLFIDEFQLSKTIGSTLKVIHDHYPQFKCIITGSASWYLDIDESMAGRKKVFSIYPLSFQEYLEWRNNQKLIRNYQWAIQSINQIPQEIIKSINYSLNQFLIFGGYPRVVLNQDRSEKIQYLSEIINSYLQRDVKIANYAANSLQIKKILTFLADRIGRLLDIQNLSSNSNLGRTALENRLELLQNTFILYLLPPYFTNKTKELVKNCKSYLVDTGLRASLMQDFTLLPKTIEYGQIAENFVVCELLKSAKPIDQILYWRTKTKQEVDIIKKQEKELIPIEIKSGDINNIPFNLKAFIKQYQPKKAYILNHSVIKNINFQNCQIQFRPLWYASYI